MLGERREMGGVRAGFRFGNRFRIGFDGVGDEKIDGCGDFGEQADFFFHHGCDGQVVFRDGQAGGFDVRFRQVGEGFRGDFRDVLLVHPGAFVQIEATRGAVDGFEGKAVDEFGEGEDFVIGFRGPSEQCDEIDDRFGEETLAWVIADGGSGVAFGHLGTVGIQDEGDVSVLGWLRPESRDELKVLGSVH